MKRRSCWQEATQHLMGLYELSGETSRSGQPMWIKHGATGTDQKRYLYRADGSTHEGVHQFYVPEGL